VECDERVRIELADDRHRGELEIGNQTARQIEVVFEISIETPVRPPSMMLLDRRGASSPMPADRNPATIRPTFEISRTTVSRHHVAPSRALFGTSHARAARQGHR
jgi:hypothetical protein